MKKLLLFVFVFILVGCSYTGAIKPDFYSIDTQNNTKLPLSIALIQSESLKKQIIYYADSGGSFEVALQPGPTSALNTALSSVFSKVEITNEAFANGGVDIVILPGYAVKLIRRSFWSGDRILDTTFTLSLRNPRTLEDLATFTNSQRIHYTPSGTQRVLAVLTGASLFILSPATIPLITYEAGYQIEKLLENDLRAHVNAVLDKVGSDPAIIKLVNARSI